ncbi:MAG: hypothetical protein KKF48_04295 [Nanoarchaeota archaeon]|nr:hypothetical protein [Nanoarchaeota archaeon]MBU1028239.1 hypothetical protein [Nanoarchaeota archaeon]
MKETSEEKNKRISKLVQNLFEEAGEVPPTYQIGFGYNCDFSFGPYGEKVGIKKPKNPEDRYK